MSSHKYVDQLKADGKEAWRDDRIVWVPILVQDAKRIAANHGPGHSRWPSTFPGRLMDAIRDALGWPQAWGGWPEEDWDNPKHERNQAKGK